MEKLVKSQNGQWTLVKGEPKLDLGHSVFTMDHVNEVSKMKDHGKAKDYAHDIVDKSSANSQNKNKIKSMIDKSKNVRDLTFGISNHIMAHPSEGLRVVKEEGELTKAAPKGVDKEKWDRCVEDVKEKGGVKSPHAVCTSAMTKGEVPDVPKPSKSSKGGKGTNEMAKEDGSDMMFSDLEQIMHHILEIKAHMKSSEDSPDWAKAKITEAAQNLSSVAHFVQGEKAKG